MISSVLGQPTGFIPQVLTEEAAITVNHVNALAPVGTGRAVLPQSADLSFVDAYKADSFVVRQLALDSAQIELGEGYCLSVNDRDRQLVLENTANNSRTVIFGDARIETASGEALQFWGTTTFAFGNDGKITLETAEAADQPGSFNLERIAVSKGPRAVIITGVADEEVDTLTIEHSDGYDLDCETRDGFVLEQASDGVSWLTEYGEAVIQELLNETAVGAAFGPGSSLLSLGEFSSLIASFLSSSSLLSLSNWFPSKFAHDNYHDHNRQASDRKSIERRIIEKLIFEQSFQRHLHQHRGAVATPSRHRP